MATQTRTQLLTGFAQQAGRIAGESADKHSTASRAFGAYAPRLDALRGVGPATLAKLQAAFTAEYELARLDAFAAGEVAA